MITAQLKTALLLLILLLTVSIAGKAIGSLQPPNPVLRGFTEGCEGKAQPCWYGIVPGITDINEAQDLFNRLGVETELEHRDYLETNILIVKHSPEQFKCEVRYVTYNKPDRFSEDYIYLSQCTDLSFGQLDFLVDYPGSTREDACLKTIDFNYGYGSIGVSLQYEDLPMLHRPAPVKTLRLYQIPDYWSVEGKIHALEADTKLYLIPPERSWRFLQLVYIDITGCG